MFKLTMKLLMYLKGPGISPIFDAKPSVALCFTPCSVLPTILSIANDYTLMSMESQNGQQNQQYPSYSSKLTRHLSLRNTEPKLIIRRNNRDDKSGSEKRGIPCIIIAMTDSSSEGSPVLPSYSLKSKSGSVSPSKSFNNFNVFRFPSGSDKDEEEDEETAEGIERDRNSVRTELSPSPPLLVRSQSLRLNKTDSTKQYNSHLNVHTVRHAVSVGELNEEESLKDQLKSLSALSINTLEEHKNHRNLWKKLRKDRLRALTMSSDCVNSDSCGSSDDTTKKSFKRKISGLFRPRTLSGSSD